MFSSFFTKSLIYPMFPHFNKTRSVNARFARRLGGPIKFYVSISNRPITIIRSNNLKSIPFLYRKNNFRLVFCNFENIKKTSSSSQYYRGYYSIILGVSPAHLQVFLICTPHPFYFLPHSCLAFPPQAFETQVRWFAPTFTVEFVTLNWHARASQQNFSQGFPLCLFSLYAHTFMLR